MADRFPLILNNTSNTIQELPSGDNLNLSGCDIVNAGTITSTGFTGPLTGNVTGNVTGSADSATTAGTVTTAAQPNITSTGTLTGLTSNGVVDFTNASNVSLGPIANVRITGGSANQVLRTDGSGTLSFATVSAASYWLQPVRLATIDNSTLSGSATIDGVVPNNGDRILVRRQTNAIQNGIYVYNASGAWTRSADFTSGSDTAVGGVAVSVQEGTNMGGTQHYCSTTGTISIGSSNINWARVNTQSGLISIWTSSSATYEQRANGASQSGAVAIGVGANASTDSLAIGYNANTGGGSTTAVGYGAWANGTSGVAVGRGAFCSTNGVAMGTDAGSSTAGGIVSIGRSAGRGSSTNAVSIGINSGQNQGANSVAIGSHAGNIGLGANSIAIGANASYTNAHANTIVINATGANLNTAQASSLYIKPIRAATAANVLYYDNSSGEVTQSAFAFPTYTIAGKPGSGSVGQVISISNSVPAGLLAYWDGTNNRWSYVYDNSAV